MSRKKLTAPPDIAHIIKQTYQVPRYKGTYEEGIFDDYLGKHIERGVSRIMQLDIDPKIKEQAIQFFWVHDLPETVLGDVTTIEKLEDQIGEQIGKDELEVARDILSPERYSQYLQFEAASDALKGKPIKETLQPAAFIARIVDIIDGNEFFHLCLTNWTISENFDHESIPEDRALTYTFESYQRITALLDKLNLEEEHVSIGREILVKQIAAVKQYWQKVPSNRIPTAIETKLDEFEQTA